MDYPIIPKEKAKELIEQKKLRPAYLYEPQNAPKGTEFVYVDFGALGKRFYRVVT